MTSFVHVDHANRLPSPARAERLADIGLEAINIFSALVYLGRQTAKLAQRGAAAVNTLSLCVAQSRTAWACAGVRIAPVITSSKESS